jgi:predicted TIM-barrel fold metal-dependent hydrolase
VRRLPAAKEGHVRAPRLDVHAHYLPEAYRLALAATGQSVVDGMPVPDWDASRHVAMMDQLGIATSLLSAVVDHPGRFGLFGTLPVPDVSGSIDELTYCYDELKVNGIVMLTNVAGTYLGDPALEPLFDELDRRHARVFIHPTSPACWERTSFGRTRAMVEFLFDTSRAVVNLVLNGTVARHPNIEWIVPHAGAALPVIADRVAAFTFILPDVDPLTDVYRDLAGLHYDLAGFPLPRQLDALLAITTAEHLHYGSDYPFTPEAIVTMLAEPLDAIEESEGAVAQTLASNTRALFPELG